MKLLASMLLLASSCVLAADVAIVEEIGAKCNGDRVTRGDLERNRKEFIAAARQKGASGPALDQALAEHEKNLLRDRIDQLLLVQKAKDLNINVDSDVAKRLASIQRDAKIADPEKFQDYLKEQAGMPFEHFKLDMKNDRLRQRVIHQAVGGRENNKPQEKE